VSTRDLVWDGCVNVRDLGGLPTEDGGTTRFGAVVRADNVTLLSDEGWDALVRYGVRRIVDLRHDDEAAAEPAHRVGVDVVHAPLIDESARFDELDEHLAGITEPVAWRRANYLLVLEWFPENFARAVRAVVGTPEGTVLVHCAGGVDRTGLVVALLLRVAGVPIDAIADDYAESEANWAPSRGEWIAEAPDPAERAKRTLLTVMPAAAMHEVLVELEARHGSAADYLIGGGVSAQELATARAKLRA
jgi:protein-tyrosine phosphatase